MTFTSVLRKLASRPVRESCRLATSRLLTVVEGVVAKVTDRRNSRHCRLCRCVLSPAGGSLLLRGTTGSDDLLFHRFDILGSGLTVACYSLEPIGVEGWRYPMSLGIGSFDRAGDWLAKIVLPPHLRLSREIWSMVNDAYIPIDWQQDIKSGYRWSQKVYHKNIAHLPGLPGVDIKVPWELARMQHLPRLALAARGCTDPVMCGDLVGEFRNQVLDFMATNPVGMGVNWTCAMDVAIRGANLLLAYDLLQGSSARDLMDERFTALFSSYLWQHGDFILRNLELSEPRNNHYLADIAGLFIIAHYLEEEMWRSFALEELKKEMQRQFHDDGTNFEASLPYHKFAAEMVLYPVFFALSRGKTGREYLPLEAAEDVFGADYMRKLYLILDSLHYLLKPDGTLPQVGDNDSGQFFDLVGRNPLDGRHILALGAALFFEKRWKTDSFTNVPEVLVDLSVMMGQSGIDVWRQLETSPCTAAVCKLFDDSGWYVMRNSRTYLLISCMQHQDKNLGVHRHSDYLSFELVVDGVNVIVDPGSYLYGPAPSERNRFRSVQSHNTLICTGEGGSVIEQNQFAGTFAISECVKVTELFCEDTTFTAATEHPLYRVERQFVLLDNGVKILNSMTCAAGLDWYNNLIFAPGVSDRLIMINGRQLADLVKDEWSYSPAYGLKVPAVRLMLKAVELTVTIGVIE